MRFKSLLLYVAQEKQAYVGPFQRKKEKVDVTKGNVLICILTKYPSLC